MKFHKVPLVENTKMKKERFEISLAMVAYSDIIAIDDKILSVMVAVFSILLQ